MRPCIVAGLLLILVLRLPAWAQEPSLPSADEPVPGPWVIGASVGLPFYQFQTEPQLLVLELGISRRRRG
jgi:hypothetical protein